MNLLVDTHVVLWWLADDPSLPARHRALISAPTNVCYVSSATVWEIAIKRALGKLTVPEGYVDELSGQGFIELPITWSHARRVSELPRHHSDPFDRLLIAQANEESLTILTVDDAFSRYEVSLA